jgi:Leucine-rich repeat (LRR) protein
VNGLFGLLISIVVFVGALKIEIYASAAKTQEGRDVVAWAIIYYIVALLTFHHALFMFLPDERMFDLFGLLMKCFKHVCKTNKKKTMGNKKKKEKKDCKSCFKRNVFWCKKNVVAGSGKYFILYMWTKETAQSIQQLVGVANSSGETEAFSAFSTAMLVSTNIVLLPLSYVIMFQLSGPTVAVATNIFLEAFIDKAYIYFSVFVRKTETAVGGSTFGESLLRHSLTLLPALMYAKSKDRYYVLQKTYMKHSSAQNHASPEDRESPQSFVNPMNPSESRSFSNVDVQSGNSRQEGTAGATAAWTSTRTRYSRKSAKIVRRASKLKQVHSKSHYVINVLAGLGIVTGLSLGIFTMHRFSKIQQKCDNMIGILSTCAAPRLYFKTGFFFGTPTCAMEDYTAFDCANKLGHAAHLFNNATVYKQMVSLRSIDVSNNLLKSLPSSWSEFPNVVTVSASNNPTLSNVPWVLCKESSGVELDASSTVFAKHVDWSNNDLHAYISNISGMSGISSSCLHSIQHAESLDLSSNGLCCYDTSYCEFQDVVKRLQNVSYLNLNNNSILFLTQPLQFMTQLIHETNASRGGDGTGVTIVSNPLEKISFAIKFDRGWLSILKNALDNSQTNSDITHLEVLSIVMTPKDWVEFMSIENLWKTVVAIKFHHNQISDSVIKLIASKLAAAVVPALESIQMTFQEFTADGVIEFARVALPGSKITHLDLSNNDYVVDWGKGMEALSNALPLMSYLVSLNIRSCGLGDVGLTSLANVLHKVPTLRMLHLHDNNVGNAGTVSLAAALPMSNITWISLSSNEIEDEGVKALARALPSSNLKSLHLNNNNQIGDEGAKALARALPTSILENLGLDSSIITDEGAVAFANVIADSQIKYLTMRSKGITLAVGIKALKSVFHACWDHVVCQTNNK